MSLLGKQLDLNGQLRNGRNKKKKSLPYVSIFPKKYVCFFSNFCQCAAILREKEEQIAKKDMNAKKKLISSYYVKKKNSQKSIVWSSFLHFLPPDFELSLLFSSFRADHVCQIICHAMKEKILIMLSILAIARERKNCEIKPSSVREKKTRAEVFFCSLLTIE